MPRVNASSLGGWFSDFSYWLGNGSLEDWWNGKEPWYTNGEFPRPAGGYPPGVPEGGYSTNPGEITQEEIIEAQRRAALEWRKTAIQSPPPPDKKTGGSSLIVVAAIGLGAWLFVESRK